MSFAQEMKDFLGAAQSTYKTMSDADYKKSLKAYTDTQNEKMKQDMNDPLKDELQKAQLQGVKTRNALSAESLKLMRQRPAIGGGAADDPLFAPQGASRYAAPPPAAPPAVGPQSSADDGSMGDQQPVQMAATGGMIRPQPIPALPTAAQAHPNAAADAGYPAQAMAPAPAIGGQQAANDGPDAEDDDDEDDTDTDISARRRMPYSLDAAHDAVKAGLKYTVNSLGLDQPAGVPTAGRQRALHAYASGAGAAPIADMNAVYKKIDPNNELSDSQRTMAGLSAVYQYKLKQGDPRGAAAAAAQMLQAHRQNAQRYAAITQAALHHGDLDGATKAAMKTYANIPDGNDLKIEKSPDGQLSYTVTNQQTGKVVRQGIATPQQLGAAAMGVATKGFDQFLLDAAGQRATKNGAIGSDGSATPGGKPLQMRDKKEAVAQMQQAYDAVLPKDPKTGASLIPKDELDAVQGAGFRVYTDPRNSHLLPEEAAKAAMRVAQEPKDPKNPGYIAKKDEDNGGYMVQFGKSKPVFMDEDDFMNLKAASNAKLKASEMSARKAEEEAKKPSLASDAKAEAGKYADDLAKNAPKSVFPGGATRDAGAIPASPPEEPRKPEDRPYVPFMAGGR